ncbi:zinc ribbon domain-containing protein [Atopobium deltae]|nr:zinc ribbon domain-containing protein [Atopobium deltae]
MICPFCGTHIVQASLRCPACHAKMDPTMSFPSLELRYCKSCGALLEVNETTCHACGMPSLPKPKPVEVSPVTTSASSSPSSAPASQAQAELEDAFRKAELVHRAQRAQQINQLPQIDDVLQGAETQNADHQYEDELQQDEQIPQTFPQTIPQTLPRVEAAPQLEDDFNTKADLDLDEPISEAEVTHAIPRIESALPSSSDNGYAFERLPHLRAVFIAAAAAVALIGGFIMMLWHPWNPDVFRPRNQVEMDTTKAGFPGVKHKLKGQDTQPAAPTNPATADETTKKKLQECYKKLGTLAKKIDDHGNSFDSVAYSSDTQSIRKQTEAANALAYEASNLINEIKTLDTTTGTYVQQIKDLLTLGSYLRNRCDAYVKAWKLVRKSNNVQAQKDKIDAILHGNNGGGGQDGYKALFDENYESMNPATS